MAWGVVLVIAFIAFVVIAIGLAWKQRRANTEPGYYSADPTGKGKADQIKVNTRPEAEIHSF